MTGASRNLPPYRAVLVVDAKDFSSTSSRNQQELARRVPIVLEETAQRCGMRDLWIDRRLPKSVGDGYIFGATPEKLPYLIYPYLDCLQDVLGEHDRELAQIDRDLRLRLRASVHVGPLIDTGNRDDPIEGIGASMNAVHRLIESDEIRAVLDDSSHHTTFVVAIISQRVFEDAVEGGFVGLHPDLFFPITATAKKFKEPAYIYVPRMTPGTYRSLNLRGNQYSQKTPVSPSSLPTGQQAVGQVTFNAPSGQSIIGSHVNRNTVYASDWLRDKDDEERHR